MTTIAPEKLTLDEELAKLITEREALAEKMERTQAVVRDLHAEYEHAREAEDLDALAQLEPRIAAANALAKRADDKLGPVARRIREIRAAQEEAADSASQRARLEELAEGMREAVSAYEDAIQDAASGIKKLIENIRDARSARWEAMEGFSEQRHRFPDHPALPGDSLHAAAYKFDGGTHFLKDFIATAGAGEFTMPLWMAAMSDRERTIRRQNGHFRGYL